MTTSEGTSGRVRRAQLPHKLQPPLKLEVTFCVRGAISPLLANTGDQLHGMGFHRLMGTVKYLAQATPSESFAGCSVLALWN